MAKSLHTIIEEGTIDVLHVGEEVTFKLPYWVKELKGILFDRKALIRWAVRHEVFIPVFHYFIKELLIAIRATARPATDVKTGKSKSIIDTQEKCQERIDEFILKEIPLPGKSKAKTIKAADERAAIKAVTAMLDNDMDSSTVHATLDNAFGKATVALAINNYEE